MSHEGADKSTVSQRVDKAGRWKGRVDELISVQTQSVEDVILKWLIDDGIASRGDRNALLSANYTRIGIGMSGSHRQFKACVVVVLASEFEVYQGSSSIEGMRNDNLVDEMPKELQAMPEEAVSMKVIKRTVSEWGKRTEVYMVSYQMKDGSSRQVKKEYIFADEATRTQPQPIQATQQDAKPQPIQQSESKKVEARFDDSNEF